MLSVLAGGSGASRLKRSVAQMPMTRPSRGRPYQLTRERHTLKRLLRFFRGFLVFFRLIPTKLSSPKPHRHLPGRLLPCHKQGDLIIRIIEKCD